MDSRQKQAIEAFQRVQDFVNEHPLEAPASYAGARKRLDSVVVQLTRHTTLQVHGGRQALLETRRQRTLKRQLRALHLRPIAKIGNAMLRDVPGITAALRIPSARLPITRLLASAMAIREAVTPHEAVFIEIGRPADFLTQLDTAIAELRESLIGRARNVGRRVGAGRGITDEVGRGRDAVEMLDTIVTTAFASNPEVLGAWRTARRVQAVPGGQPTANASDESSVAA